MHNLKKTFATVLVFLTVGCSMAPPPAQLEHDALTVSRCRLIGVEVVKKESNGVWVDFNVQCPMSKKVETLSRFYSKQPNGQWELEALK
jgi:hypothetical protein